MLGVLDTRDKGILSSIIIFISLEIIFVKCFLNTRHVTIHLELVSNFHLLIEHFLIAILHLFSVNSELILNIPILFGLYLRLIAIKSSWIIHFLQIITFLKLHFKLLVIKFTCLLFLSFNKILLPIIPIFNISKVFLFFLNLSLQFFNILFINLLIIFVTHVLLKLFNLSLPIHLKPVIETNST